MKFLSDKRRGDTIEVRSDFEHGGRRVKIVGWGNDVEAAGCGGSGCAGEAGRSARSLGHRYALKAWEGWDSAGGVGGAMILYFDERV